VAVMSYRFWQQRFGGESDVLNRQIVVNGQSLTVVGVASRGFNGVAPGEAPALFIPVTLAARLSSGPDKLPSRRSMWLNVIGRMKPGVSRASAEAALNVFWKPILAEELSQMTSGSAQFRRNFLNRRIVLQDAANGISMLRILFQQSLVMLMGLVGLVLLIACTNVANLLIARAAGRQKEIAIRLAVGATRGDIIRQILAEGMILSAAGGALGLLVAMWGGRALLGFLPFDTFTATISADPDWRILAFTAAVCLACGIAFGLAPAWQTTRPDLAATMKQQAGGVISGTSHVMVRKGLVVAQVALSLLLLAGAGLFLRSLDNLRRVDLGFRADHLTSFSIHPSLNGYSAQRSMGFFHALQERLATLPGVRAVAVTQTPVLANVNWASSVVIPGYQPKEGEYAPNVDAVGSGYFEAMGIPLEAGRDFRETDDGAAPRVAIVNQTFAQYYFGGANPVGRQFYFTNDAKKPVEIVGLVRDGKYTDVREGKQRFVFYPYAQHYESAMGGMTFYVRASASSQPIAPAIRQVVRDADPSLPISDFKTMSRQIDDNIFADRIVSMLASFFGGLATVLAAIGLYGVLSYSVTRRTREIGIRMALGAGRREVLWMVLREVVVLAALGIGIAIPLSLTVARLARSMLYGVAPHDAWALGGAVAVLALTALASGYLPAARAARIDPLIALRNE
jgi:predicted permease